VKWKKDRSCKIDEKRNRTLYIHTHRYNEECHAWYLVLQVLICTSHVLETSRKEASSTPVLDAPFRLRCTSMITRLDVRPHDSTITLLVRRTCIITRPRVPRDRDFDKVSPPRPRGSRKQRHRRVPLPESGPLDYSRSKPDPKHWWLWSCHTPRATGHLRTQKVRRSRRSALPSRGIKTFDQTSEDRKTLW
jgi:hypothetical protein